MRWRARDGRPTTAADLSFHYDSIGRSGVIDQTLSIRNRGSSAVALRLTFAPLDANGQELPGLTTTTAYGTDSGRHIIPARFTDIDVLAFQGPGFRDVADVRVQVEQVEEVPFPAKIRDVVLTDRIDSRGNVVGGGEYAQVRLTNPSREPVPVRVALLEYEDPPPGRSQQAVNVQDLGGLVTVPGRGTTTIPGPTTFPDAFVSVKAYFSR
ncbi:hypothetical protein [Nocardioides antri]|uniref:Uncharacterized protein n=1 Tax=Nocardioides antri TaxID=2607659 RepID=A0A5B1M7I6_9ACTN|nr:hypothetical protein [Nocardioides antri]KAA1428476.1 hypothetical protein F0U47_06055 [Nocardioides antri]